MPSLSAARHGGAKLPGVPLKPPGSSAGPLSLPAASLVVFPTTSFFATISQLVCNRNLGHNVNDADIGRSSEVSAQLAVALPGAGMLTMRAMLETLSS